MENYNSFDKNKFASLRLLNEPSLAKQLARILIFLFVLFILFMFLPWTQNINSTGAVTTFFPNSRPQSIQTIIPGRIDRWMVHEGQYVHRDDTILVLTEVKEKYFDPYTVDRVKEQLKAKEQSRESLKQKADALRSQINALKNNFTLSLEKANNKIQQYKLKLVSDSMDLENMKTNFQIATVQFKRYEELYNNGLKSLTDFEEKKLKFREYETKLLTYENKYNSTKQDYINSVIEKNSVYGEYNDKIAKAESDLNSTLSYIYSTEAEISKMNNEYQNVKIRNGLYVIIAPQAGFVVKTLKAGIGETIKEGESVATIMPNTDDIAVELYIKPLDYQLISKGTKVRLQFDGWPALVFSGWPNSSFGTYGGIVEVIDKIDSKGKYRILVVPDPDEEKWPQPLPMGSGVYGWAMLKDVPMWFEIWRELNGFPPDYIDHSLQYHNHVDPKKAKDK